MANDCAFVLYVAGRRADVGEVYRRLEGGRDGEPWFAGVRSLQPVTEPWVSLGGGDVVLMAFYGCCAWSVETSLRDPRRFRPGSQATCLEETARVLDVDVEVFGRECGQGIAEHYVYEGGTGDCLMDEASDYCEYWYEEYEFGSFEEFVNTYGLSSSLRREDLDDDVYCEGGFDESPTISAELWARRHEAVIAR